jgi:cystathionine beta-lyase
MLVKAGHDPFDYHGFVHPPVIHASTVLYKNVSAFREHTNRYSYGRRGTPTSEALEKALAQIEGPNCETVTLLPSGLSAIEAALVSVLKAGDHVLVTDSVYGPTRDLCDKILPRFGITASYFDPCISGADIEALIVDNPKIKAVFLESPGSLTFEMQDVPAIAKVAHKHGAVVLMDNTWATPIYFPALDYGVDLSIQAATKYIGGHSDLMIGAVASGPRTAKQLREMVFERGLCVGPDVMNTCLRGLRTMGVRLDRQNKSGLKVARWLEKRSEILKVVHPALESHPTHEIWQRDFKGACGLFSVIFKPAPEAAVDAFVDQLKLFPIGYSWGGYESLAMPFDPPTRTATKWEPGGPTVRFHIGVEDVSDLLADLEQGFAAFAKKKAELEEP